jgi:hypothetical protein
MGALIILNLLKHTKEPENSTNDGKIIIKSINKKKRR